MIIQSLSIAAPAGCPNKCGFCVSQMHDEEYVNQIECNRRFRALYKRDYEARLAFARDNNCNTLLFTGNGEPLMNKNFIEDVANINWGLSSPFRILELQTSGAVLDDETLRWLRDTIGVSTISLSLSSIWSDDKNAEYNGAPDKFKVNIEQLCKEIKRYDFNLRLSLNMTDEYDGDLIGDIFNRAGDLSADQITFRKLYKSGENTSQDKWIDKHAVESQFWTRIASYVQAKGHILEKLPFGAWKYSINEMSVVIDDDCMSTDVKEEMKYLVLRPNCKLYSKWNDKGSLIF